MVGALCGSGSNYATPKKEVMILPENCSRHSVCSNDERMEKALTMQQQRSLSKGEKRTNTVQTTHFCNAKWMIQPKIVSFAVCYFIGSNLSISVLLHGSVLFRLCLTLCTSKAHVHEVDNEWNESKQLHEHQSERARAERVANIPN